VQEQEYPALSSPDPLAGYDTRRGQNSDEYAAWVLDLIQPADNHEAMAVAFERAHPLRGAARAVWFADA
jgi:hypothetical protein